MNYQMKIPTIQKNKKRLKPKEHDVHLKYSCTDCGCDHWLSLLEASTTNFKIVCDCGVVFRVKKVIGIKLLYDKTLSKKPKEKSAAVNVIDIDSNLVAKQAIAIITNYGFTNKEAKDLIKKCYDTSTTYSVSDLVKQALELIKVTNESLDEAI